MGEHAPEIRDRVVEGLGFLGAALDDEANFRASADVCIQTPVSAIAVAVLTAHEDLEIARQVGGLLHDHG